MNLIFVDFIKILHELLIQRWASLNAKTSSIKRLVYNLLFVKIHIMIVYAGVSAPKAKFLILFPCIDHTDEHFVFFY